MSAIVIKEVIDYKILKVTADSAEKYSIEARNEEKQLDKMDEMTKSENKGEDEEPEEQGEFTLKVDIRKNDRNINASYSKHQMC